MSQVLIIDDEEKLRSLLARIIRLEGWSISESSNLKNAHKIIEKEEPDVILCDVKLPDGSGIDFVREVKQKNTDAE
ncbi:MAG TPA: response regulator, partial [Chitinophagaceae bacterium]|nr:response regulator [Chitinophagaceae bacterium]